MSIKSEQIEKLRHAVQVLSLSHGVCMYFRKSILRHFNATLNEIIGDGWEILLHYDQASQKV